MPFYDYVCTACGTRVEVMHSVNESGPAVCSSCGGSMRKSLSAPAIVFKGSGWAKKERADVARKNSTTASTDAAKPADAKPKTASGGTSGTGDTGASATGSTGSTGGSSTD